MSSAQNLHLFLVIYISEHRSVGVTLVNFWNVQKLRKISLKKYPNSIFKANRWEFVLCIRLSSYLNKIAQTLYWQRYEAWSKFLLSAINIKNLWKKFLFLISILLLQFIIFISSFLALITFKNFFFVVDGRSWCYYCNSLY